MMSPEPRADGALLEEFCRTGDEKSLEELVRRHTPMVLGVCRRVAGNAQDAEDATQAVFITLALKAGTLRGRPSVAGWLYQVAWNVSMSARRAAGARRRHEREAAQMIPDAPQEENLLWSKVKPHLDRELAALPETYRLPLILHHMEGMTQEETARVLGCRPSALSMRLVRGRERLRAQLSRCGVAATATALAVLLSSKTVLASAVPAGFVPAAVKGCALAVAGDLAAGAIPGPVLALSQGAIHMLTMAKLKVAAALAAIALLLPAAGWAGYRISTAPEPVNPVPISGGVPVTVEFDRPGYATVVLEREDGTRVCNLVSEMPVSRGKQTWIWDLYDVGHQRDGRNDPASPWVRRRVKPGSYRVRGLVFDHITPRYEFSVYSPGDPPWKTDDGRGSWLSDHCPPLDAVHLPAGSPFGKQPQLMLCATMAESGTAIAWVDEEGRKLGGGVWGWDGAAALARDEGPAADPRVAAHGLSGGLSAFTLEGKREKVLDLPPPRKPWPVISEWAFLDLAVRDGLAVVSNSDNRDNIDTTTGNLLVVDLKAKKVLANHATGPSRGVAFGPDGRLYALIGGDLRRMAIDPAGGGLSDEGAVVRGLEDPRRVRFLGNEFYVGVWGGRHQVEVFDRTGKKLRTIGKPGGLQVGAYDEERMGRPEGMALDGQGRLWVMEGTMVPKRMSLWDARGGKFQRAIYGRPLYGGGGFLDPQDKTCFYYPHAWCTEEAGLRFRLDWTTGQGRLESIYGRSDLRSREDSQTWNGKDGSCPVSTPEGLMADVEAPFRRRTPAGGSPPFLTRINGRRYVADGGAQRTGDAPGFLWLADGPILKPVAFFGPTWPLTGGANPLLKGARHFEAIKAAVAKAGQPPGAVWSDRNGDGIIDPEEIEFLSSPDPATPVLGVYVEPDLSLTLANLERGHIPAPAIDARGVPRWDLSRAEALAYGRRSDDPTSRQGGEPLVGRDHVVLTGVGWETYTSPHGYRRGGGLAWVYRHYDYRYVPQFPGQMVSGMRRLGPVMRPAKGEAGEIWCTNGDKGAYFLMTMDGLFLRTIGGDMRTRPLHHAPRAQRGMAIENVSFEDENFGGSIQQAADGEIYLVAGKEHSSILRLDGLETVRRRDWGAVTVTSKDLAGLPESVEEFPQAQTRKELDVYLLEDEAPPKVDGRLDDWEGLPSSAWAFIDARTRAAVQVGRDRLYAAFRTGEPRLLENSADDPRFAFKGGGAIDLFLTTGPDNDPRKAVVEGDCRLLVTRLRGKKTAILYRPVAPGAPAAERCVFESPIGKETFASVTDVSESVELAQQEGDYEISVPLGAVLRAFPNRGKEAPARAWGLQPWREQFRFVVGDLGIIRGNGTQNVQRLCWNNLDTVMVSDIPSEARLRPQFWGLWNLSPRKNVLTSGPAPAEKPKSARPGLAWDYWELAGAEGDGTAPWGFADRKPDRSGEAKRPDLGVRKRDHAFALRFTGLLAAPKDGWYRFDVWGDSGARLKLGDRVASEVRWWSEPGRRASSVYLKAGTYPLELLYWKKEGGRIELVFDWSGPDFSRQPVPEGALCH